MDGAVSSVEARLMTGRPAEVYRSAFRGSNYAIKISSNKWRETYVSWVNLTGRNSTFPAGGINPTDKAHIAE